MSFITLLGIAIGLGMDAFAVSVSSGCKLGKASLRQIVRMAVAFGLFQGLMPLLGWGAGSALALMVSTIAPWIAVLLLGIVAMHMIVEGIHAKEATECTPSDPTRGWTLLVLAVATSIDAFAVGTSLSLLGHSIVWPAVLIAAVAALMSAIGMHLGCKIGGRFGKRMEIAGGAILLLIAVRIAIETVQG